MERNYDSGLGEEAITEAESTGRSHPVVIDLNSTKENSVNLMDTLPYVVEFNGTVDPQTPIAPMVGQQAQELQIEEVLGAPCPSKIPTLNGKRILLPSSMRNEREMIEKYKLKKAASVPTRISEGVELEEN